MNKLNGRNSDGMNSTSTQSGKRSREEKQQRCFWYFGQEETCPVSQQLTLKERLKDDDDDEEEEANQTAEGEEIATQ